MSNKFLNSGISGESLTNGTADVFINTLTVAGLSPNTSLKTNGGKEIVSSNIEIQNVNGLQEALSQSDVFRYNGTGNYNYPVNSGSTLKIDEINEENIAVGVIIEGNLLKDGGISLGNGNTVNDIKDEDDMISDSATALCTQQSIKKYVDDQVVGENHWDRSGTVLSPHNSGDSIVINTINEETLNNGVQIDEMLIKDDTIKYSGSSMKIDVNNVTESELYVYNSSTAKANLRLEGTMLINDSSFASPYALSLQSSTSSTWLEILNSGGANKGAFFGITNNDFEIWNYQAGKINFYTDTTPTNGISRFEITNDGICKVKSSLQTDAIRNYTTNGNITINALSSVSNSQVIITNSDATYKANLIVDGGIQLGGVGNTVTAIKDEDDMISDSDTALCTQQSIKKYVDDQIVGENYWDRSGTVLSPHNSGDSVKINTINEETLNNGVQIDQMLIKDDTIKYSGASLKIDVYDGLDSELYIYNSSTSKANLRLEGSMIINDSSQILNPYPLSIQSDTEATWMSILNSAGYTQGILMGIATNDFKLSNYQGGSIIFSTDTNPTSSTPRFEITNAGICKAENKLVVGNTNIINEELFGVYSNTGAGTWRGMATFGGATAKTVLGEISSMSCIGAHNAALSAWAPLHINEGASGTNYVFIKPAYSSTGSSGNYLMIQADGRLYTVASIRAGKTNIIDINKNPIYELKLKQFNRRKTISVKNDDDHMNDKIQYTDEYDSDLEYGLIAEDTELVDPTLCSYSEGKINGVKYQNINMLTTLELQRRNKGLVVNDGGTITMPFTYDNVVTGNVRDLQIDENGLLGYAPSLRKYKSDAVDLDGLFIHMLKPKQFTFKGKEPLEYGLIAEEVEKTNKHLCMYDKKGTLVGVDYKKIICPLIAYTQSIQKQTLALAEENKKMKDLYKSLLSQMSSIHTRLAILETK